MKIISGEGFASILHNTSYIFSAQVLNIFVRAIYILLVARLLGPEIYGVFVSVQAWYIAFLPLSIFGMQGIISLELAKSKTNSHQLAGSSLSLRLITSLLAGLSCFLSGWFLNDSPDTRNLILLFSTAMLGRSLATWNSDIFIAYERSQTNLRLESIFRPMEAIMGSGWLLFANGGINELALIHALNWWLQASAGLWLVKKNFVPTLKPLWDSKSMIHMLMMALPLLISGFAVNWFSQGPIVLLKYTSLPQQTIGYLALAFQIFSLSCAVPFSLGTAALPVLSRAAQRNDSKDIFFAESMIKGILFLAAPAGIAGIYIIPALTPLIFGEAYIKAGDMVAWSVWLLIPFSIGYLLSQVLIARKKLKSAGFAVLLGAVIFSMSYIYFTDTYGVYGSLFSSAFGMIIWAIISLIMVALNSKLNIIKTFVIPLMSFSLIIYISFNLGIF
ncbi:MAG: oligosaccharide flippase family protein [Methylobacter sp.]|nr:oligosaccharide flippase family protein [Methylobacter sp.]